MNINFITLDSRKSTSGFLSYWFKPIRKEEKGEKTMTLNLKFDDFPEIYGGIRAKSCKIFPRRRRRRDKNNA
jgi:hypothetical protein